MHEHGTGNRRAPREPTAQRAIVDCGPFANATRTTELEWLRDASVNLLSLDLSRWTDISVVDDKPPTCCASWPARRARRR